MAITGVHTLLYSTEPDALRAMLRDVFGWHSVDVHRDGQPSGWLIFALPPAELGVHPSDSAHHEISLMCDDIEATKADLEKKGATFSSPIMDRGFGLTVMMDVPGADSMMLYQPKHKLAYNL